MSSRLRGKGRGRLANRRANKTGDEEPKKAGGRLARARQKRPVRTVGGKKAAATETKEPPKKVAEAPKKIEEPKEKKGITLEEGWKVICETGLDNFINRVEDVHNLKKEGASYSTVEELVAVHDKVHTMSFQREPNLKPGLYDKAGEKIRTYFTEKFVPSLEKAKMTSKMALLQTFAQRWKQCTYACAGTNRMFSRLNEHYVKNKGKLEVDENGYDIFQEVCYETMKEEIKDCIVELLIDERNEMMINRALISECVQIFIQLGRSLPTFIKRNHQGDELYLYKSDLENHFLKSTGSYYEIESQRWIAGLSVPAYLRKVENIFVDELERIDSMFHPGASISTISDTLKQSLLVQHQDAVLYNGTSGLQNMFNEASSEDLGRLYRLYKDVDGGIEPVAKAFSEFTKTLGFEAIDKAQEEETSGKKKKDDLKLISKMIDLHDRFHGHVIRDFQKDVQLLQALRDAFQAVINKTNYVTRYLAKFTHVFMMKGGPSEKLTTHEKTEHMRHIQMIYSYIRDKDVFEREYGLYLSHRLLSNTSSSDGMEQEMIGYLKAECAYHWSQKLEDMFKDIQTSKHLMKDFKTDCRKNNEELLFDLQMNICEYGKWPEKVNRAQMAEIHPPEELQDTFDRVEGFYKKKHPGRLFFVRWDRGSGEMVVTFNRQKKIRKQLLFKSTYQIMIMLCFNRRNKKGKPIWTWAELKDMLGVPENDLMGAMMRLIHPQLQIIQKRPGGKTIEDKHMFRLNSGIQVKNKRIAVPPPIKMEAKVSKGIPPEIVKQRKFQMEAALVRIMKARRTLKQAELIGEVIAQLEQRFKPDPKLIQKYMEGLIAQDYLERDEDERGVLHYIS